MKKITAVLISLIMALSLAACGSGKPSAADAANQVKETQSEAPSEAVSGDSADKETPETVESSAENTAEEEVALAASGEAASAPADEETISPEQLLKDVTGTYDELFTVICDPQYDQLWLDKCTAIVGEEMAPQCAEMLKGACTGTLYGDEAAQAYAADPENAIFDCYFIQGIKQFVFDGSKISGLDAEEKEVFSHDYSYLQDIFIGGMLNGYVYETADEDAGEFKYFVLLPDTPATTFHIEFRYGSNLDALADYAAGPYAYWLAAGIPADRDDKMIENVIQLFAEENLAGAGQAEEGTEAGETIEIGTAEELQAFAKSVSDGSKDGYKGTTVLLTSDIDCSGIEWVPIGTMNMENMNDMTCMFQGVFDGQNHTISNVTFSSDYPVCGVGVIGMNLGEVKNLTVKNVNISCTDTNSMAVGGVVGYNMYGSIHDVTLTGENSIAAVNAIGGIAGGSTGTVNNCTVDGTTIKVLGDNDFSSGRIIQCDIAECGGLIIGGSFGGTMDNCNAKGTVIAEGNEPVGMGGIAGCLEMMDSVTNCTADVKIVSEKGGHAIGGLCGFSGTHSVGDIAAETEGIVATEYPGIIDNCSVTVKMNVPGATHVGGLVGTGLYYYGEETAFKITNCTVKGEITGAVTPGAVAGRAENSVIESCDTDITLDGAALTDQVGSTDTMYESSDQTGEDL